jgi:DNA-binding SARP family transcriptional activator
MPTCANTWGAPGRTDDSTKKAFGVVMAIEERIDVRLSLAGAFELSQAGRIVDVATPAQRVLAFLALNDGPVDRGHAASVLWRDSNAEHAAGSLRSALWRVRQHDPSLIEISQRTLRLAPGVRVDAREMVRWARRVCDTAHLIEERDVHGTFAAGELLVNWDDDWVRIERERLRQLRWHAIEILSHRLLSAGRYVDALEVALVGMRTEPLRESAHRSVIAVHLAEGNVSEALRHFRSYRDLLRAQLGLEPSDLMTRLVNAIDLVDAPAPGGVRAAFVTAARAVTGTSLVGSLDAAASRS